MFTFSKIPANMDKQLYVKTLSKEYKMPLDMIHALIKDCVNENDFFKMLQWNLDKNGYNRKK